MGNDHHDFRNELDFVYLVPKAMRQQVCDQARSLCRLCAMNLAPAIDARAISIVRIDADQAGLAQTVDRERFALKNEQVQRHVLGLNYEELDFVKTMNSPRINLQWS